MNFPFICSNIATALEYAVYIFPMIRSSRACGLYQNIIDRELLLIRRLLKQWFLVGKSSFI